MHRGLPGVHGRAMRLVVREGSGLTRGELREQGVLHRLAKDTVAHHAAQLRLGHLGRSQRLRQSGGAAGFAGKGRQTLVDRSRIGAHAQPRGLLAHELAVDGFCERPRGRLAVEASFGKHDGDVARAQRMTVHQARDRVGGRRRGRRLPLAAGRQRQAQRRTHAGGRKKTHKSVVA